jgi:hypothetical protein
LTDKEKVEGFLPFDSARYKNVDLDHLILFVMGQLKKIEKAN